MSKKRIGARAKKKQHQWQEMRGSVERLTNALMDATNNQNIEEFESKPSIFIAEEHFEDLRKFGKCKLTC
ncbi:TPA: hypothetical protein ACP4YQ_004420 [Klebsiella quasipneumoniae]|uniref:hypothetical protein n=1 Tax=Klebsiella quasipneumoniae TaxID=1463165 RepID=UPI003D008899